MKPRRLDTCVVSYRLKEHPKAFQPVIPFRPETAGLEASAGNGGTTPTKTFSPVVWFNW